MHCAPTNVQLKSRSEREKVAALPNTFKEAMRLVEVALYKAAWDKETGSLKHFHVYNLVPPTSIPVGKKQSAPDKSTKSRQTRTWQKQINAQNKHRQQADSCISG